MVHRSIVVLEHIVKVLLLWQSALGFVMVGISAAILRFAHACNADVGRAVSNADETCGFLLAAGYFTILTVNKTKACWRYGSFSALSSDEIRSASSIASKSWSRPSMTV